MIALIVVFTLLDIFGLLLLIKEIYNYKDFKETFKCEHCNTLAEQMVHSTTCKKCNRTMKNVTKSWEHYLTFRVSRMDTKNTWTHYNFNEYSVPFKLEITIDTIGIIVITLFLITNILEVLM